MKHAPTIAGILLGLLFVIFGSNFFLQFIPMPADPSPADAPHKLFMGALFPTGYLAFVKVLEILGGLLVAIPRTRNAGLLVLGPIIVNIIAFHVFLLKGAGVFEPVMLVIYALTGVLLWAERKAFGQLLGCCCNK
jgi:putative oxidoreductase